MSKNNPNAIDWAAIKTEYITSTASYRKLAEKYGVSYRYMSVRGRSEGWVEARRKYQEGVTDKIIEKVADERANRDTQKLLLLQKNALFLLRKRQLKNLHQNQKKKAFCFLNFF